jgi:hypothetical protein
MRRVLDFPRPGTLGAFRSEYSVVPQSRPSLLAGRTRHRANHRRNRCRLSAGVNRRELPSLYLSANENENRPGTSEIFLSLVPRCGQQTEYSTPKQRKRLTNTPVCEILFVLEYFDDRRKQVVSAPASHQRGSSEVGGEIQEQRYAPKRVLRESPKNLIAATPHDNFEQDEDEAFWPGPMKSASRQEIKY